MSPNLSFDVMNWAKGPGTDFVPSFCCMNVLRIGIAVLLERSTSASSVCREVAATAGGLVELGMEGTIRHERSFERSWLDDLI